MCPDQRPPGPLRQHSEPVLLQGTRKCCPRPGPATRAPRRPPTAGDASRSRFLGCRWRPGALMWALEPRPGHTGSARSTWPVLTLSASISPPRDAGGVAPRSWGPDGRIPTSCVPGRRCREQPRAPAGAPHCSACCWLPKWGAAPLRKQGVSQGALGLERATGGRRLRGGGTGNRKSEGTCPGTRRHGSRGSWERRPPTSGDGEGGVPGGGGGPGSRAGAGQLCGCAAGRLGSGCLRKYLNSRIIFGRRGLSRAWRAAGQVSGDQQLRVPPVLYVGAVPATTASLGRCPPGEGQTEAAGPAPSKATLVTSVGLTSRSETGSFLCC